MFSSWYRYSCIKAHFSILLMGLALNQIKTTNLSWSAFENVVWPPTSQVGKSVSCFCHIDAQGESNTQRQCVEILLRQKHSNYIEVDHLVRRSTPFMPTVFNYLLRIWDTLTALYPLTVPLLDKRSFFCTDVRTQKSEITFLCVMPCLSTSTAYVNQVSPCDNFLLRLV